MPDTEKKVLSKIILLEGGEEIEVEKAPSELLEMLEQNNPLLIVTGTDGKHYAFNKMAIKMIVSDTEF